MGWKTAVLLENCIISYLNDTAVTLKVGRQPGSLETSHHKAAVLAAASEVRCAGTGAGWRAEAWVTPSRPESALRRPSGHETTGAPC